MVSRHLFSIVHQCSGTSRANIFMTSGIQSIARTQRRLAHNPADSPDFLSIVDHPPILVKSGRRHGYGLIVLGLSLSGLLQLCLLSWSTSSYNTHYGFCPWYMASVQARVEDRNHSKIWRPIGPRAIASTSQSWSRGSQGFRLQTGVRIWALTAWSRNAYRASDTRWEQWVPGHYATRARRIWVYCTCQPRLDPEEISKAGGSRGGLTNRPSYCWGAAAWAVEEEHVHARQQARTRRILLSGCSTDG